MSKQIIITDWCNNVLFEGDFNDPEVRRIVLLNRDTDGTCPDIEVNWVDEANLENLYECIDY